VINILLVCGSGASSGFIAQSMRKAAKIRNLEAKIKAVSDAELMDFADEIDVLMIGPHLKCREEEIREKLTGFNISIGIIDKNFYGSMNGEGVLDQALDLLKQTKGE